MQMGPILRSMWRNKFRFGLSALQIAVTLAIVANCLSLVLDARRKMSRPPIGDEDNLIQIRLPPPESIGDNDELADRWVRENFQRLREVTGVRAITNSWFSPWRSSGYTPYLKPVGSTATGILAWDIKVDEFFLDAIGVELAEGRWFTPEEVQATRERLLALSKGEFRDPAISTAIISQAFGRAAFGDGPLLDQIFEDQHGNRYQVIGVFRQSYLAATETVWGEDRAFFRIGWGIDGGGRAMFVVRAEPGQAAVVARRIEARLSETYDLPEKSVMLVSEQREVHHGPERMLTGLMGLLIFLLLFVASVGIAGLISFSVTARTRQIGTRRALGATRTDILRYFLAEAWLCITVGQCAGVGLAVLLNFAVMTLYATAKLDVALVAASALLLWIVGLGAALPPALRASRVSPAIATKNV